MRLRDKVALISGAASGMGAATAKLFASEGAIVFVTDLDESAGLEVVEEINAAGHSAHFIKLDVSRDGDWQAAVSEVMDAYGRIDVLVNNAGISGSHPDQMNTATWDEQMNVYAKGVFLGMQAVVHQGRIELGLHVQQAGLFVGITTGPVGVGLGYSPVQKTQGIHFHRDGGDHLVVFHRY